jgi:hypothetical protein
MNFVKYVCLDLHLLFGLFGLYLKLPNNSSKILIGLENRYPYLSKNIW